MLQPTIESLQETTWHTKEKMTMDAAAIDKDTTMVDELSSRSSCGSECHRKLRGANCLECINCGQEVGQFNDRNLAKDVFGAEFDSESNFSS